MGKKKKTGDTHVCVKEDVLLIFTLTQITSDNLQKYKDSFSLTAFHKINI